MRRLRKLLALPPARIGSIFTAGVLLAMARWKHAHQPIAALIDEIRTPYPHRRSNAELAAEIAWALQTAAAKVPWRADCLIRAVAARYWAERLGIPFEFHLGVSTNAAGELEAHAWTVSGAMFLSGDIPELTRFKEFDLKQLLSSKLHFSK